MTEAPREIEAKFAIDEGDHAQLIALERAGTFRVTGREILDQRDIYFDTPSSRLGMAKSTVRVRWNEHGVFMTFKGRRERVGDDAHVATRLEDEVPLSETFASAVSLDAPLPDDPAISPLMRARALAGDEPLRAICQIANERVALELSDEAGATLELAVDRCRGTRASDGRVTAWDEVEIETKSADRQTLANAVDALREVVPTLRPNHTTKLERALG